MLLDLAGLRPSHGIGAFGPARCHVGHLAGQQGAVGLAPEGYVPTLR